MIKSRKHKLIAILTLVCTCSLVIASEPNEVKTELKFEVDNSKMREWVVDRDRDVVGPVRPTHVAVFNIQRPCENLPRGPEGIIEILKTPTGRTLSEKQRQFLTSSDALVWMGVENVQNNDMVLLYAVSEHDAKKTVQAYLEVPTKISEEYMQNLLIQKQEFEQTIRLLENEKAARETKQKNVEGSLRNLENRVYYLSVEEAQKAVERLNKTLDELNIETAGMRRKFMAIEEALQSAKRDTQNRSSRQQEIYENTIWPRIEQMRIDLIIELAVAEEKMKIATHIRDEARDFYNLSMRSTEGLHLLRRVKERLSSERGNRENVERRIKNPPPGWLPPKVFQNKVTIFRVKQ